MPGNRVSFKADLDDHVSSGLEKIRDKLDQVGGKGAAATFTGVAAAKGLDLIGNAAEGAANLVHDFIGGSIQAASDLNETVSKAHVVFGSAAGDIESWGKTAATSMGLSENAALSAAASIGNLLLSTGTAPAKIAPMSKGIVQLASDLASFNNIPIEDALAKLQSGLVGQERPLRELGVAISAASVDAEAAALGFHKVNGEFSEGEKVQARYSLIFKQTATAQGDFARTSDQLANSQRIANAELEDYQAALGKKMLPVQLEVTKAEIGFFQSIQDTADAFNGNITPSVLDAAAAQGKLAYIADNVRGKIHDLTAEALDSAHAHGVFTDAQYQAEIGLRKTAVAMDYMAGRSKDDTAHIIDDGQSIGGYIGLIGQKAGTAEEQAAAAFDALLGDFRRAKGALQTAGQDAADAFYDPQITKLDEYKNARAIKETEANIKSGKLRGADLADAKLNLLQLKKDRIGLLTTLAQAGDTAAAKTLLHEAKAALNSKNLTKDQKTYWQAVILKIEALDDAARLLDKRLKALDYMATHTKDDVAQIPGIGGTSSSGNGRASGGPVMPGQTYTVGEQGPETLIMGGAGGYVQPGGRTGDRGDMAPVVIPVILDGREVGRIFDERFYYLVRSSSPTAGNV